MSSQVETAGSDSPKSRSKGLESLRTLFLFEGGGALKDRLLTALIVLTVAFSLTAGALWFPYGNLLTVAFTGAVAVLCVFEVVRLFARDIDTLRYQPMRGAVLFLVLVIPPLAAVYLGVLRVMTATFDWRVAFMAVSASALALVVAQVFEGRRNIQLAARDGERIISAYLLVSVCAPQFIMVASAPTGTHLVWWIVGIVALNDAAAYFAGRSLGRTKMAPALSPNKTIEGSVAGLVAGALAGWFFWELFVRIAVPVPTLLLVAMLMTLAAQAADLSKSYLKRLRGVKDTGAFFPGHGGVLDRFDGMIGASPVVLFFLVWLGLL